MPYSARNAVIKYGGTTIAYGRNITIGITGDIIKDWSMDALSPAILEYGNQSYPISIEHMFVDKEYANLILAGTKVSVLCMPMGTATGAAKAILCKNAVLSGVEITMTRDGGAVIEGIAGEGLSLRFTTAV